MSEPALSSSVALTPSEQADLRWLAGLMIPADRQLDVPSASDPSIVADMIGSLGREGAALKRLLAIVRSESETPGARDVQADGIASLVQRLRERDAAGVAALEAVVVRAYYRDDRVMSSIGMEPRPPFPKGYVVDEGDWSLLGPVKARGRIWRDVT